MIPKGSKFKLLKRGYPDNSDNWFGYDDAVKFEETLFPTLNEANQEMLRLCEVAGTDGDPNFITGRPLVLSESEFIELMGEDLPFSWY